MKGPLLGAGAGAGLMALVMGFAIPQIQTFEGNSSTPYRDIGGVLTVCSGHTGPDVTLKKIYTDQECETLTETDATKAASGVLKVSPHLLYHPLVLASAVSFSYNVGVGTYDKSSVARAFNSGDFVLGCNDLLKYDMAGGKYNQGLHNRRVAEQIMCLSTLTPAGVK
jgi:lysozyme